MDLFVRSGQWECFGGVWTVPFPREGEGKERETNESQFFQEDELGITELRVTLEALPDCSLIN